MIGDLLQTKLFVPPLRPNGVRRPHLTERLDQGIGAGAKLTLVSAPAGFGKSTLISEWIHLKSERYGQMDGAEAAAAPTRPGDPKPPFPFPAHISWLSLDQGDNELPRFLAYLVAALQEVDDKIGVSLEKRLQAPRLPSVEPLLASLINDIVTTPSPFVLVMDDFHTITALEIYEAVDFLLEHQPPKMHLVIITRQDPSLSLSRLRGRGQVTEIRQTDLRFSTQEMTSFFRHSMSLELTESEIAVLGNRTEGWIVGLQLAALALRGRTESKGADGIGASEFVAGFSGRHHFILDYLTDEVLERQPKSVQRFLLRSSLIERICGPLCDAVVMPLHDLQEDERLSTLNQGNGEPFESSQAILEYLDHANLFLVPLDDERKWYRYHHLFGELLRARVQESGREDISKLHRQAAIWHEQNGFPSEAVHHSLQTRDFVWAADLIERFIKDPEIWSSTVLSSYLTWLNSLPEQIVQSRPWLRLFASRVRFIVGEGRTAQRSLEELELWLLERPNEPDSGKLLEHVLADRASYAAVLGEVETARSYARRILAKSPDDEPTSRVRPLSILGLAAIRAGDLMEAHDAFSQALQITLSGGESVRFAAVPLACNLADIQVSKGQLGLALRTCAQALELGTFAGKLIPATGFANLVMGRILYERNDLGAAEKHLRDGLERLGQGGISDSISYMQALLAAVKQAQGDGESASQIVQDAARTASANNIPRLSILLESYQARILLRSGAFDQAAKWAREYQKIAETEYLREFEDLTLVRVLLAQKKLDQALLKLRLLLQGAEPASRTSTVIEIHLLSGLAQFASGDEDGALRNIRKALALAEPEGYVRIFINEGKSMARLLYNIGRRDPTYPYARHLLSLFEPGIAGPSSRPQTDPTAATKLHDLKPELLVDPLTKRELEVLQHLAEGLSNREIAQRLYLSPNTIRTHTYNLYSKLGVHNRMTAVARARELGLLPS
jgi:LuxR family maltose regulon positive regulatory protein